VPETPDLASGEVKGRKDPPPHQQDNPQIIAGDDQHSTPEEGFVFLLSSSKKGN
jgi:hypothetical protein